GSRGAEGRRGLTSSCRGVASAARRTGRRRTPELEHRTGFLAQLIPLERPGQIETRARIPADELGHESLAVGARHLDLPLAAEEADPRDAAEVAEPADAA